MHLRNFLLTVVLVAACDPVTAQDRAPATDTGAAARVGTIADRRVKEASGIAASRKYPGVYWTHNDGNDGVLYGIRRDGASIGAAKLDIKLHDWEDLAIGDDGALYVANTGNNSENRKHLTIARIDEPEPKTLADGEPRKLEVKQSVRVRFPDDPFNCESLIVWRGFGYLISKHEDGQRAQMYRFDPTDNKTVMEKLITLPIDQPVTAADLSADGKHLAVLTRGTLFVFEVDGDLSRAADIKPTRHAIPNAQVEGVCFGDKEILIVAESAEIFAVPFNPASPTTRP